MRYKISKNQKERRKIVAERRKAVAKRIKFLRYKWQRFWKLERQQKWRRARGIDNKIRMRWKGYPARPTTGYGTPRSIRGLHPSGLKPVVVSNMSQIESLKGKGGEVLVYLSSKLSLRKRELMSKRAKELGIRLANG